MVGFRRATAYGLAAASVFGTAFLGSQYTQQSVRTSWYTDIRPAFAPPAWVFPIVWTLLYVLLAIAFGASILGDSPLIVVLHCINLLLNILWCRAFFGERDPVRALGILVGNLGVAGAILTGSELPTVRLLVIPYLAWLVFATALNGSTLPRVKGY